VEVKLHRKYGLMMLIYKRFNPTLPWPS